LVWVAGIDRDALDPRHVCLWEPAVRDMANRGFIGIDAQRGPAAPSEARQEAPLSLTFFVADVVPMGAEAPALYPQHEAE
jgi:hypothetical protein